MSDLSKDRFVKMVDGKTPATSLQGTVLDEAGNLMTYRVPVASLEPADVMAAVEQLKREMNGVRSTVVEPTLTDVLKELAELRAAIVVPKV